MKVTSASIDFPAILRMAKGGEPLSTSDTRKLFDAIFTGQLGEDELIAYLSATADRKPTVDELVGAVTSMRHHMRSLSAPAGAIALGRAKQVVKPGLATKLFERLRAQKANLKKGA